MKIEAMSMPVTVKFADGTFETGGQVGVRLNDVEEFYFFEGDGGFIEINDLHLIKPIDTITDISEERTVIDPARYREAAEKLYYERLARRAELALKHSQWTNKPEYRMAP